MKTCRKGERGERGERGGMIPQSLQLEHVCKGWEHLLIVGGSAGVVDFMSFWYGK
jgi:hypothetical protein